MKLEMRQLLHIILYCLTILILTTGCSGEDWYVPENAGEEVVVSFPLDFDDAIETRSISDGKQIGQLIVVAKDSKTGVYAELYRGSMPENDLKLRLISGRTYNIVFWAQAENAYMLADGKVSANYTEDIRNGGFKAMKSLDAFSASRTVEVGKPQPAVILQRSVAQLNFADNETAPVAGSHKAVVRFDNIPTSLDLFTGEVSVSSESMTFIFTDFTEETLPVNGSTYNYVASNYILVPSTGTSVEATLDLQTDGTSTKVIEFKGDKAISIAANKRTNVLGTIVELPATVDTWDGITLSQPEVDPTDENRYIIDQASDLAWMSVNGTTLERGRTFVITTDIDMAGKELSSIQLPDNSTISSKDGKARTIKNFELSGAVFADATGINVSDLTVEDIAVNVENAAKPTHVGVLVNTLKGSSTFTNITITNSSAKTSNGAAGGIVGKIERKDEKNLNESLEVKFINCNLTDVKVEGTRSNGYFVGLFNGYDRGETLSFDADCSSSSAQKLSSYYSEGNESGWQNSNNYSKYNSWLGDEEYCRGTINFGDIQFIPKWDGTRKVEPLKIDNTDNRYYIYSAFDLAYIQSKSPDTIIFKEDVDLGGVRRADEWVGEADDRGTNSFNPINSITNLDGENHTIHNLYIELQDWIGGFILYGSGGIHKNLKFKNSSVIVHFITVPAENDSYQDHAYAGTLTPYVGGTSYTAENIEVIDGFVFGMGKIGGVIGVIEAGMIDCNIKDCNVSGTTVKNEKGKSQEVFRKSAVGVTVEMEFYSHGEAGGLIGMIRGNAAISNCHVTNSTMDCYGEANKSQEVKILGFIKVTVTVQGRHVNNFIGDIRTQGYWIEETEYTNVVTIDDCSATDNTYVTTDGKRKDDPFKTSGWGSVSTNLIGTPYYLNVASVVQVDPKGSVKIDGVEFLK